MPWCRLTYVLFDWLNWEQAGKVALLGAVALLAVSAWTTRDGYETKAGKSLVLLTAACFFVAFGFHAFLREFFGVTPDDNVVTAALFSSDQSEAGEFIQQHARLLAKHIALILLALAIFGCLVWWKPAEKRKARVHVAARRAWKMALGFSMVFVLLHLNPSLRKQNPLLYFPMRYSAWKHEVESVRQLQAENGRGNLRPRPRLTALYRQ